MLQLASTCEAMGIPKETVKTLRRWDRVHMIKELAGVAVRQSSHIVYGARSPASSIVVFGHVLLPHEQGLR